MEALKFTDPEVASRFVATVDKDRMVELPGVYAGMLSNIHWSMARKMVRQGCTHVIREIEPTTEVVPGVQEIMIQAPAEGEQVIVPEEKSVSGKNKAAAGSK